MSERLGSAGPAGGRQRCPTCNAPRRGDPVCHRCKSDLTRLVQLERHVDALRAQARRCYARGWYRQAAPLARRIVSLEASPDDVRLMACALLLCGDYPSAWRAYARTGQGLWPVAGPSRPVAEPSRAVAEPSRL